MKKECAQWLRRDPIVGNFLRTHGSRRRKDRAATAVRSSIPNIRSWAPSFRLNSNSVRKSPLRDCGKSPALLGRELGQVIPAMQNNQRAIGLAQDFSGVLKVVCGVVPNQIPFVIRSHNQRPISTN